MAEPVLLILAGEHWGIRIVAGFMLAIQLVVVIPLPGHSVVLLLPINLPLPT